MILKHILLILLAARVALSYKKYVYSELCPVRKFKTLSDSMTDNNKPVVVRLSNRYAPAALIHFYSDESNNRKIGTCEFNVTLDRPGNSEGIFASIIKLKLRESVHSCTDYLRFTYKNGTRTSNICGNIETSMHNNLIQNFFDETSGELKVEIVIDSTYATVDVLNGLEVELVFTAYTDCAGDAKVNCSPEKCISDIFQNDNILNCPPPGCLDEHETNWPDPIIISLIIVWIVVHSLLCRKKKKTADGEHVEEQRSTGRSDQRYDTPMSPAPPCSYEDEPPTYEALFSKNHNAHTNV